MGLDRSSDPERILLKNIVQNAYFLPLQNNPKSLNTVMNAKTRINDNQLYNQIQERFKF